MVSIRRRKLLGLCSGRSNSFLAPLPKFFENGYAPEAHTQNTKPFSVHPMPSNNVDEIKENPSALNACGSSNAPACTEIKEQHIQQFPDLMSDVGNFVVSLTLTRTNEKSKSARRICFVCWNLTNIKVKRRKRHRRKHFENQEQCMMRGVYFKNMKWQAAIKVDKKQIHLGTVGSQEEAARLYDRAAFMCGREPNFELSEEDKQELRKFKWDEFLAITRSAINHKKHYRRTGAGSRKSETSMQKSDLENEQGGNGFSGSEDTAELDTSES